MTTSTLQVPRRGAAGPAGRGAGRAGGLEAPESPDLAAILPYRSVPGSACLFSPAGSRGRLHPPEPLALARGRCVQPAPPVPPHFSLTRSLTGAASGSSARARLVTLSASSWPRPRKLLGPPCKRAPTCSCGPATLIHSLDRAVWYWGGAAGMHGRPHPEMLGPLK